MALGRGGDASTVCIKVWLMVYVWCYYGNEIKFFKLRKEEKEREFVRLTCARIRGFFPGPPALVSRERKEDNQSS
jgi:hypothetical protein